MSEEGHHVNLKSLLKEAHHIFSYPRTSLQADEYNLLSNVIKNIDYFNDYLEPPANMHDFCNLINHHIKYETHRQGTVLIKEGDFNEKFYIVLHGYTYRLIPRPFEDIEKDVRALVPMFKRKVSQRISVLQPVTKPGEAAKPNYLKHTKNTFLKKGHSRKSHFATAINIAIQEATQQEALKNASGQALDKLKTMRSSFLKYHIDNITIDSLMAGKDGKKENKNNQGGSQKSNKPMRRSVFIGKERGGEKRRSTMIRTRKLPDNLMNARRESVDGIEEISDEDDEDDSDEEISKGDKRRKSRRESTSTMRKINLQKERRSSKLLYVRRSSEIQKQQVQRKKSISNNGVKWADTNESVDGNKNSGKDNAKTSNENKGSRMDRIEGLLKTKKEDKDDNDEDYEDIEEEEIKKIEMVNHESDGLGKEDFAFIKRISAHDVDLQKRLLLGGVMKVKREKGMGISETFGEGFWDKEIPRYKQTVVVGSDELHVLVVTREAYDLVMHEIIKLSESKVEFFQELFPNYDDRLIKRFAYNFSEKEFKKGEIIYSQNDSAHDVYVVKTGDIRLYREVHVFGEDRERAISKGYVFFGKDASRVGIPVISVMTNQFFGDEVFIKTEKRQHTAISSSTSFIYFLEPRSYQRVKTIFADILQVLGEHSKERFQWRKERVIEIMDRCNAAENTELSPRQQQVAQLDRKGKLKYQIGIRWGKRETLSKLKPIEHSHSHSASHSQLPDQTINQSVIKNTEERLPKEKSKTVLFNSIAIRGNTNLWPTKELEHLNYSRQSKKLNKMIDIRYLQKQVQVEFNHQFVPDRHDPTKKYGYSEFNVGKELSSTYRLPVLKRQSKSPNKGAQTERYVNVNLKSLESSSIHQHLAKSQSTKEDISPGSARLNRSSLESITEENAQSKVREAANRASVRPAAIFGAIKDEIVNADLGISRSSSVPKLRGNSDGMIRTRVVNASRNPSIGKFNPHSHTEVMSLIKNQRGVITGTKLDLSKTGFI